MSKTKLTRILCVLLLVGTLIVEGLAFLLVYKLKMLPSEYLVLLAAVLLLLWVALAALLFVPAKKKNKPVTGRLIGTVILVVIILAGSAVAAKMTAELQKTLNHITAPVEMTALVDVFVTADDKAEKLEDLDGYVFAITEYYDIENTRAAIEKIEDRLGGKITTVVYPHVHAMADALLSGEADALLINTAYISLLEDVEKYEDFEEKAKLIEQINITIVVETPDNTGKNPWDWVLSGNDPDNSDPNQDSQNNTVDGLVKIPDGKVTETPFVIYLAGCDSRKHTLATYTRNDVNILAVVNPNTKQILLINTPRDYYVPNPAGNGALDKLTHCGVATVENSVAAMSQFYKVPIRYYAQIGFEGLKELVDAVDGVSVYSEVSYQARDTWIQKGTNYLNGAQALDFARERKNIDGGDNARGNNQMKIIKAVANKMISGKLITRYTSIMRSLRGMFRTNMSTDEMGELVQMQLTDMASWNIVSYAVTGEAARLETYSVPGEPLYVYIPNMDTVEYAKELMQRVVDGEILEQSDIIPAD